MSKQARFWFRVWGLTTLLLLLTAGLLYGQSISGTLTGVVSDASGAVVPNAKITLTNTLSGDVRRTITNADGLFVFASVPAASYTLLVENPGFLKWEQTGIALAGAERRNVDITLQIGSASEKVEVVAATDIVAPVDSGEKASVLTTKQLQDFAVVGRNAAEFIKIMPGFGISGTGTENRQNFSGEVIGTNANGDAGSQSPLNGAYSYNGLPGNSLDITADGSHVSDPGCNCDTPVNPNTDMIQEFKVLTSNFSAENSKGPAVINTIAKAGTRDFHGMGYFYARHYALNSNDWLNNSLGRNNATGEPLAPKPENKFFFPGANIGGPVLIPGTNFNKNRDKLFFFTGFEYFYQKLDTGVLRATVPTEGMRAGDFSPAEVAKLGTRTAAGAAPQQINQTLYPGGMVPASDIDPTGKALMGLLPLPNANADQTGGFNYIKQIEFNQNMIQWMSRVDYSISDNTKLFVRYNLQKDRQLFPVGLWWRNANQVPYPTDVVGKNSTHSVSASLTHVFSPTLTNEFVAGYTAIFFPNVFDDPKKVDRAALGIPFQGVFKNGVAQVPSITGWGGEFATLLNPGGFEVGGTRGLYADKYMPTFGDNLTKVMATHTLKAGVYYEWIRNTQPGNGNTNGQAIFSNWGGNTTGSAYADLLTGRLTQYNEQNFNRVNDIAYNTFEVYVQDSWKITRRLTLELGLRASHFQNWYDNIGYGFAVWDPSKYNASAAPRDYTGWNWYARDNSVPLTGYPGTAIRWQPRFGLAYDIFGSGNTVLRGGWGRFYYHTGQFTSGLDATAGVGTYNMTNATTFKDLMNVDPSLSAVGVAGVDPHDDRMPMTDSWSFTVSQRTPGAGLLEVSYVGNSSRNLQWTQNMNAVPYGALFGYNGNPADAPYDTYRQYRLYQDVAVTQFRGYSNYNAMQASWVRQRGRYNLQFNYTYGKALGTMGGGTGVTGDWDQFNIDNNYGPLPTDRRHIFNAAYSVELPSPVKGNKLAGGLVNGWQFSGITQWQSGINLAPNTSSNPGAFAINANGATMPGTTYGISERTINGTESLPLRPILTCDPGANLKEHQYVNGACLALPTQAGVNGPMVLPELSGPPFFNSDLGLYKNFYMGENRKIQFRFNAYNFLNHPLYSFISSGSNLNLTFDPTTRQLANQNFGITTEKQGRRIIMLALKFYF